LPDCIKELKPKKVLKQLGENMTNVRLNKAHFKNNKNRKLLKIIQTNNLKHELGKTINLDVSKNITHEFS
jgi:hypothetical protein